MSQDKGKRAARWVADYMRAGGWFPLAEATPNGRSGADLENTPGVSFEVKTGATWRNEWLAQAAKYLGAIRPLIYLQPGIGESNVANAQMILPLHAGMRLLQEAGYTAVDDPCLCGRPNGPLLEQAGYTAPQATLTDLPNGLRPAHPARPLLDQIRGADL